MENIDKFTFRNGAVKKWLIGLCVVTACIALIFPPAHWLMIAGALLIASGIVAQANRTDQHMTWENEGPLNWFEGWAVSSGAIMIIIPLVVMLIRWLLQP